MQYSSYEDVEQMNTMLYHMQYVSITKNAMQKQ